MSGELRTQGTQVWVLDDQSTVVAVLEIPNITDVGEFGAQADDIDVTNLMDTAKQYLVGLPDNGEATLQVNFNPQDTTHQFLNDLAGTQARLQFMVGLSDGVAAPTNVGGVLTTPSARTTAKFTASVKTFRTAIKANDADRTTITLRISGAITWHYKP